MAKLLWKPTEERIAQTNLTRFIGFVNQKYGKNFKDYPELHQWSVDNIPDFWSDHGFQLFQMPAIQLGKSRRAATGLAGHVFSNLFGFANIEP